MVRECSSSFSVFGSFPSVFGGCMVGGDSLLSQSCFAVKLFVVWVIAPRSELLGMRHGGSFRGKVSESPRV